MFLAAFEPGPEMAIANFFLAVFCLFTISIPLLLVTRGNKTEANRNFIAATINPWSKIGTKIEVMPVVISAINPSTESAQQPDYIHVSTDESILESERIISIDTKISTIIDDTSSQGLVTNDEPIVA